MVRIQGDTKKYLNIVKTAHSDSEHSNVQMHILSKNGINCIDLPWTGSIKIFQIHNKL